MTNYTKLCKACWRTVEATDTEPAICDYDPQFSQVITWNQFMSVQVRPMLWSLFVHCEVNENSTIPGIKSAGSALVFDVVIPEYRLAIDFIDEKQVMPWSDDPDRGARAKFDHDKEELTRQNNWRWVTVSSDLVKARNELLDFMNELRVLKVGNSTTSQLLTPKLQGDAGWDILCSQDMVCPPQQGTDIPSDLFLEIPNHLYGVVQARSSTSKRRLLVLPGVIDPAYRGQIFVMAYNLTDEIMLIKKGDRIAQLLFFNRVPHLHIQLVDELRQSERGTRGFGSTG